MRRMRPGRGGGFDGMAGGFLPGFVPARMREHSPVRKPDSTAVSRSARRAPSGLNSYRKCKQMGIRGCVAAAAVAIAIVLSGAMPAAAQQEPFGQGFENWQFTQAAEQKGKVINCRAIRKIGGRLDILAFKSDGTGYVSVNANGMKGRFPKSTVATAQGKFGAVTAVADGPRLVFGPLQDLTLDAIAQQGWYVWTVPGPFARSERVDLGKRATQAVDRIFACIKANGG